MADDATAPVAAGPGRRRRPERMAAALLRARVLLSSYAALNLILFWRVDPPTAKLVCLGLAVVGALDGLRLTWLAARKHAADVEVTEVRDAGSEVAAYLATYLLPLLAAPDPDTGDLVGYAIYALVIVVISLRSNLAHVNPTLYLLGWKVVTVRLEGGPEQYLICREAPVPGKEIPITEMYGVLHAR